MKLAWPIYALWGVIFALIMTRGEAWGWLMLPPLLWASWKEAREQRFWPLPLCLAFGLAGGFSQHLTDQRPDPLAKWSENRAVVVLKGRWDGQFLSLQDPPARVVLSPRPEARRGEMTVQGRLLPPRERAAPGGFDQKSHLKSHGGLLVVAPSAVLVGAEVKEISAASSASARAASWFERGWAGLSPNTEALMRGLELGDRADLSELTAPSGRSLRDVFAASGLSHILALSGQHVALLSGAVLFLLSRFGVGLQTRFMLVVGFLLLYGFVLVQPSPSVIRAVCMGVLLAIGMATGRGKLASWPLLCLVAAGLLILFPAWLSSLGFLLSFLSVAGLLLLPKATDRLPPSWRDHLLGRFLLAPLLTTVFAQAATLPIVASAFGGLPSGGVLANLLALPIAALLVPLGFLAGALGPLGGVLRSPLEALTGLLVALADHFASWPLLAWGGVSFVGYAAHALCMLALALWLHRRISLAALLGIGLGAASLTFALGALDPPRRLVFLDVGQGDATLIQTPHFAALVDGGGTPHGDFDLSRVTVPALRSLGVFKLDVVVATHADTDHIEGLVGVLKALPVGELWVGDEKSNSPLFRELLQIARQKGVRVRAVRRGDQTLVDGLRVEVLWPPEGRPAEADSNAGSVALRLASNGWRAALLGDLPSAQEAALGLGPVDLLKVAHHGSAHSSGEAFLKEARPKDAVISVGYNNFGHPHADVLERLAAAGARVWRTDEQGSIIWPMP